MNLNSDSDSDNVEDEDVKRPDDTCVILEVKQPVKRRKPKKIGQFKKRHGKKPVVKPPPMRMPKVDRSKRKRYNSESEEAVSDTDSEHDAVGKEGRLQRRTIKRIRNCITDPKELERFEALPEKEIIY